MPFTDDDMKRLKEHVRLEVDPQLQIKEYEALLFRLEAAEEVVKDADKIERNGGINFGSSAAFMRSAIEQWKQSKSGENK